MNVISPSEAKHTYKEVRHPSGGALNEQNVEVNPGAGHQMVNPHTADGLIRMQTFQLRKEPDSLLNEMYESEGGQQSRESDEHFMMGCMSCCGSMCMCCTNEQIDEGYVGVITEFGKYKEIVTTGAQSYNCCTQRITKVPVMIQVFDLPNQRVLTKDGLQLLISAFVKYRIIYPQLFTFNHGSARELMMLTVAGTLRSIIGTRTIKDNLAHQIDIKRELAHAIKHRVEEYGIVVMDAEIQQMSMDVNLQRALATVAESERQRKAKKIKAKAALESSQSFRLAADELSKNPLSLQLKYLDLIKEITTHQSKLILRDTIVTEMQKKNIK